MHKYKFESNVCELGICGKDVNSSGFFCYLQKELEGLVLVSELIKQRFSDSGGISGFNFVCVCVVGWWELGPQIKTETVEMLIFL